MAKALDANVWPVHRPQAKPDGRGRTFRIRQALVTFRFVELLTRTPTPRPLRSSSWGTGSWPIRALAVPATAPCPQPLASPILELPISVGSEPSQIRRLRHAHNPRHHRSSSCRFPWGPSPRSSSDCTMPTTPSVANPHAASSRWVRALADPATAPCPQPLAFPIFVLSIPVGSELWQLQRLPHARCPWRFPTS